MMSNASETSRVVPGAANVTAAPALSVGLATSIADVRNSQRLRYRVFAEEMGASLEIREPGLDSDAFDPFCRHVVVRDQGSGEIVASTRVLSDRDALLAGGFYSESEFDLRPLLANAGPVLEIGRTCVHPDYRSGAAISLLWAGLARCVELQRYEYLIGCASIAADDGGANARAIYETLKPRYLVAPERRVTPRRTVPANLATLHAAPALPPLLKAYLRLGARIGGEPCLDPAFGCADLLVVLPTAVIERRYARHFLERSA